MMLSERWYNTTALTFFFAHSALYIGFLAFFPDATFTAFLFEGSNFNLRFLDPSFWIFWFLGFDLIIISGLFRTRPHWTLLFILSLLTLYVLSAILIIWGFPIAFLAYTVLLCLIIASIWANIRAFRTNDGERESQET